MSGLTRVTDVQPLTVKLLEHADRVILLDESVLTEIPPRFRFKIEN